MPSCISFTPQTKNVTKSNFRLLGNFLIIESCLDFMRFFGKMSHKSAAVLTDFFVKKYRQKKQFMI